MKTFAATCRLAVGAVLLSGVALVSTARADDVSEEQIAAARATIQSLNLTIGFDRILPNLAEQLKAQLIQASPNYTDLITSTVDEKALSLAARRGDLEREASRIYAKTFTLDELKAISAFYQSDVGKKLLKDGPVATREMMKAADIWASGVSRDLAKESDAALQKTVGAQVQADGEAKKPADAQQ